LQTPTFEGLEENVFSTFTRLYQKLEEGKKLVRPNRFCELRYEDLVRDPIGEMEKLYANLSLGDFDEFLPRLKEYLDENADYETNRYELSPEQEEEIERRWGSIIRQYGYEKDKAVRTRETRPVGTPSSQEMIEVGGR
jgi:hypothetical protein